MKTNTVFPWEGKLVWVGDPRTGKTKAGKEWKSVDFTLKYTDNQNQEKTITFNTFGTDNVDKILSAPIDTDVRVTWKPDSHEYNGKWYSKLDAYDILIAGIGKEEEKKEEKKQEPTEEDNPDLPF